MHPSVESVAARLLLVDDDQELTGMLSEVLADEGYVVDTVPERTLA